MTVGEYFLWCLTVWERKSFGCALRLFTLFFFSYVAVQPPPSIERLEGRIDSSTISAADNYFTVDWVQFDLTCNYSATVAFMLCQIHIAGCCASVIASFRRLLRLIKTNNFKNISCSCIKY